MKLRVLVLGAGTAITDSAYVYVAADTAPERVVQEKSSGDGHTIGSLDPAGVAVVQAGAGTPWIGVARFDGNPCPQSSESITAAGDFVDVLLENPTDIESLTITVAYTATSRVISLTQSVTLLA